MVIKVAEADMSLSACSQELSSRAGSKELPAWGFFGSLRCRELQL